MTIHAVSSGDRCRFAFRCPGLQAAMLAPCYEGLCVLGHCLGPLSSPTAKDPGPGFGRTGSGSRDRILGWQPAVLASLPACMGSSKNSRSPELLPGLAACLSLPAGDFTFLFSREAKSSAPESVH